MTQIAKIQHALAEIEELERSLEKLSNNPDGSGACAERRNRPKIAKIKELKRFLKSLPNRNIRTAKQLLKIRRNEEA